MLARSKGHFYSKHLVFFRPPLQFLSWYLVATNVLFSILWCCSSDDYPKVYLAKFDNIQNMKVEKS
jgi:hypothetical protein